jgi:hypothetical protein
MIYQTSPQCRQSLCRSPLRNGWSSIPGEIHATPVNDRDDAHPELTNESLQMLKPGYRDRNAVKDALGRVGDQSLGAEVTRWNALKKKVKHIQDQIQEHEDQLFALSIDQRAC